jgi:hypothetical protein
MLVDCKAKIAPYFPKGIYISFSPCLLASAAAHALLFFPVRSVGVERIVEEQRVFHPLVVLRLSVTW